MIRKPTLFTFTLGFNPLEGSIENAAGRTKDPRIRSRAFWCHAGKRALSGFIWQGTLYCACRRGDIKRGAMKRLKP